MIALAYWLCFLSNCLVLGLDLSRYIKRRRDRRILRAAAAKVNADMDKMFEEMRRLCECPACKKATKPKVLQ